MPTTCLWLPCVKHLSYSPVTSERYLPMNATEDRARSRALKDYTPIAENPSGAAKSNKRSAGFAALADSPDTLVSFLFSTTSRTPTLHRHARCCGLSLLAKGNVF